MKNSRLKKKLIAIYEYVYYIYTNLRRWAVLRTKYRIKIMSSYKTLKYIQNTHCSITRYGDGELSFALKLDHSIAFQNNSPVLSEKLSEVLKEKNPDLLICMPRYFKTLYGCTKNCKRYWWEWGKVNECQKDIILRLRQIVGKDYVYGDALISRPYMDIQNVKYAEKIFCEMKKLWSNRKLLIVEGEQTRLGIGNDLFSGSSSIERILAPAVNAFEYYDEIKKSVLEHYNDQLVLLALGPTATVLASELSKEGIQTIDIGHVDIEYEWFLHRQTQKVPVAGKYTNETEQGRKFSECRDEKYRQEIIDIICR